MKSLNWQSPWPQWRTHWHVWHAWPLLAQALLLFGLGLCAGAMGSWYWSAQAWQAWMYADEEDAEMRQTLNQLRAQSNQIDKIRIQLQDMKHPAGVALAAWQPLPKMDVRAEQTVMMQLAKLHGLQLQMSNDEGGQWHGPLPNILAALQSLSMQMPHYRLSSFKLKRIDEQGVSGYLSTKHFEPLSKHHKPAAPVMVQLQWQWTATAEKDSPLRPAAIKPGITTAPTEGSAATAVQVLHNPFAADGLVQALPQIRQQPHDQQNLLGKSLDQMHWLGMLSSTNQVQALVHEGQLIHVVKKGEVMGQDFGEVVKIAPDHLLLQEWRVNELGQWQMKTTRFPSGVKP